MSFFITGQYLTKNTLQMYTTKCPVRGLFNGEFSFKLNYSFTLQKFPNNALKIIGLELASNALSGS